MTDVVFASERTFQLFEWSPEGGRLLLRGESAGSRVDVLFSGTTEVRLVPWYRGLRIRQAAGGFLLESAGRADEVRAASVAWHEGRTCGGDEPSFFADPDPAVLPPSARRQRAYLVSAALVGGEPLPVSVHLSLADAERQETAGVRSVAPVEVVFP
ncbi:hypothetical protein JOF53_007452 [Crossiella equi]|uniref:Uncharacterized protein n=1 Tax=Crossiella equi TaxID=130796 RepID=A0ABS5APV1_9PSEU|nr:hypothetical protein [Crossiella equi]MBP2478580.1 hypothetical protein [Crossiella equi]